MKQSNFFNKIFFWVLPILAVIVWALDVTASPAMPIQPILAKLSGLLGIAFIANSFLHASRFGFIEKIYGGLDKVYKAHQKSGRYAYVFILVHPLFLATKGLLSLESLRLHFLPGDFLNYNTGIAAFYLLNVLLLLTLVIKLPYQIWKRTHKLMIVVLLLASLHVFQNSFGIVWLFNFALIMIGTLSFIYREWIYGNFSRKYLYEVVSIKDLDSITELELEPKEEKMLFQAGQFVFLKFVDSNIVPDEGHPYSISSSIHNENIRISSKSLGDYSEKLKMAKKGDVVKIVGPHGRFTVNKAVKKQLWISGGIGTTPFLSMLYESDGIDLIFIHSNRNEKDAVYLEEIQLKANTGAFKFIPHYSDTEGFINAEYFKKHVPDFKDREILICGPSIMMYKMRDILVELGADKNQIRFEDFNFK